MNSMQVVLITGSSTGFGRLFAETLARKGHTVFATMRDPGGRNAKNASEIRALAEKESLPIHVLEMDVTDEASVERAVDAAIAKAGRIDVAINNAGHYRTSAASHGHEFSWSGSRKSRRAPAHAAPTQRRAHAHQQRRRPRDSSC